MATMLPSRNSNLNSFSATTITLNSTMVSLGASTNSVYTRLSQGNFASSVSTSSWVSSLTNRLSTTTVAMSANAQYQLALSQSSISTSVLYTSTLGLTPSSWSTLSGASGLPNFSTVSYTAGAISGDGRYGALGAYGGYLYTTSTFGSSWTNTNPNIPRIYLPFENSITDSQGNSNVTTLVTPVYVPGIIGNNAINIANTTTGTIALATQYVRGTWANNLSLTSYTVSFWFNQQSNSGQQYVFSAFNSVLSVQINNNGHIYASIPSATAPFYNTFIIPVFQTIMLNTWYNITLIYQSTGVCYLYLNNTLYGTVTGAGIYAAGNSGLFSLGSMDNSGNYAFNGYIDDLKIYNSAITFTPMVPQNWSSTAVSNTGQYMLATVTNGGLYMSSNFGSTWSQVTGAMLSAIWSNAQVSATGQYMLVNAQPQIVQPQLTGLPSSGTALTTSPWQANGITWIASASSVYNSTFPVSNAFNNSFATLNGWVSSITSTYNSSGAYIGTTSTNIVNGSGAVLGEWLQIQSSVPLQMYSYNFASGNTANIVPKVYYIVGSNDNVNWYIIQTVNLGATCPFTAINIAAISPIIINQSGSQTMNGGNAVTFTPGTAATSTSAFIYFRLIVNSVFGTSLATELGEWFINFQAGGQTYSTNYGTTWLSGLPLYTIIQPQLPGISTTTWQTNGNTWTASASTSQGGTTASYLAFNNTLGGNNTWASAGTYTAGTGVYTGSASTPNIVGTGTYTGEWLQIQSSTPIVMNSYSFANGGNSGGNQAPRIYQIVGSNDNSTWYSLQTVTVTGNPYALANTYANTIIVNSPGTFAGSNGSSYAVTTTTFTTGAYSYFRLCVNATIPGSFGAAELGEWVINFTSSIQTSQALSESGQYALNSYIPGTIVPQQTGLTTNTWNQGGVGWTASASSSYTSNFPPWATFNNANSATGIYSWASAFNYTSGVYIGSVTTPITGIIPNPMPGEWLQIQSSIPLVMHSYNFGAGNSVNIPKNYYIVGSNDGITWAPIQYVTMGATNPFTNNNNSNAISSNIIVNQSGTQMMNGGNSATLTCTIYPSSTTTAYNYFRIIANVTFGPGIGVFELAEWFLTFTGPTNTSLYNVVSPLTGLSTNTYTSGTIPGVITNSAISNTGQYMLFITNNTSGNNVYYSMNYGATFTGLQLGTSVLTSCAMSYDGSYMTIASGATVYTLNNNSTGFSLALGNQAGAQNQANNAIAIGNYAGYQNQTANSIILNASGSAVNAYAQGFYVAPIASYTASSSQTFALLGYGIGTGADNQVIQNANITMTGNLLTINSSIAVNGNISSSSTTDLIISTSIQNTWITLYPAYNNGSGYPSVSYGAGALSIGYTLANNGEIDFVNNYGMTGNIQYGITGGFNFYNRTATSSNSLLAKFANNDIQFFKSGGTLACGVNSTGFYVPNAGYILSGTLYNALTPTPITPSNTDIVIYNNAGGNITNITGSSFHWYLTGDSQANWSAAIFYAPGGVVYPRHIVQHKSGTNSGTSFYEMVFNGNVIGSITQSGTTGVSFNPTSDYRLKSNIKPIDTPFDILQKLKPCSFTWTNDNINDLGFIAHEFAEVFPDKVINKKDEINEDGSPKYQLMSNSVCIPLLVACVKEQQAQVAQLISQNTAQQAQIDALLQRLAAANIP